MGRKKYIHAESRAMVSRVWKRGRWGASVYKYRISVREVRKEFWRNRQKTNCSQSHWPNRIGRDATMKNYFS